MKKQYLKSTGRLFLHHLVRLLSISAIFFVSVSLITGIFNVCPDIKNTISASYVNDNLHDFILTGDSELLNAAEKEIIEHNDKYGIADIERSFYFDLPSEDGEDFAKRLFFFDKDKNKIDKLLLVEGNWPDSDKNEVVVERETSEIHKHNIGDMITIHVSIPIEGFPPITFDIDMKVVGVVNNPTMVTKSKEPSMYYTEEKPNYLDDVFYSSFNDIKTWPIQNLVLTLKDRNLFKSFSSRYENEIQLLTVRFRTMAEAAGSDIIVQTLFQNYSLYSLNSYAEKVNVLAIIFVVFFMLITILVVYSTMSRLLDEERSNIAVLKTLGYSNFLISLRYLLFALIAGVVGSAIAVVPAHYVGQVIIHAFAIQYTIRAVATPFVTSGFFMLAGATLLACLILTIINSVLVAKQKPVELLTHKAPKVGGRIFLERIKGIWKKLSFKYKSTFRNVFLFKARFFMTVLSIIASTVIVFASLALLNNSFKISGTESLRTISAVLLVFSAALCALVVYNITNINISERTREIATLMVLGYRNKEVTGYIYREIYIMTGIGAILGLPIGVGFIQFIFVYVSFGELGNVEWWSYVITPIITFIFALLAARLLHHKIVSTNMNDSLKVLE